MAITPTNAAASAAPIDCVAPWICEPIQSHASGVPAHSTIDPITMIATTSTAPAPVISTCRIDPLARPRIRTASASGADDGPGLTDSRTRA